MCRAVTSVLIVVVSAGDKPGADVHTVGVLHHRQWHLTLDGKALEAQPEESLPALGLSGGVENRS